MSDDPCADERESVRQLRSRYETRMAKLNVDQVIDRQRGGQNGSDLEPIEALHARLTAAQERLRDCEQVEESQVRE